MFLFDEDDAPLIISHISLIWVEVCNNTVPDRYLVPSRARPSVERRLCNLIAYHLDSSRLGLGALKFVSVGRKCAVMLR
jgi:hypothetical protein